MNSIMDGEIDITGNIRAIEMLKSELLGNVAELYKVLSNADNDNINDDIADLLSDAVLTSYILARRLGLSYNSIETRLGNKIRAGIVEENVLEKRYGDMTELSRHLSGRKGTG